MNEEEKLQMRLSDIRSTAYAATNPANWQKPPNDMEAQWKHWQKVLDEIADEQMPEWIEKFFTERERLRAALEDLANWCEAERSNLGAIDGYDYSSGQEYGLRRAQIEIETRLKETS